MRKVFAVITVALLTALVARADENPVEASREQVGDFEVLDRNVRLDFKLVPQEEGDNPVFIITAVPKYRTRTRFSGDEGDFTLAVSGAVSIPDKDTVLVVLDAEMSYQGHEGEANFHVACGILLVPGKEQEVAKMGEKTLVVRASYVGEAEPRP